MTSDILAALFCVPLACVPPSPLLIGQAQKRVPLAMIEAMHGPYHGCVRWFVGIGDGATVGWRESDPQRWDGASVDDYISGGSVSSRWVCDIEPRFLFYDMDGDMDVDLHDYALFVDRWGR